MTNLQLDSLDRDKPRESKQKKWWSSIPNKSNLEERNKKNQSNNDKKKNTNKPGKPAKPLDLDHENEITQ